MNKWSAGIYYDGKRHNLGYFEDEEEAARAYDKAARAHHREKAQLSFPTQKEQAAEEAKQQQWIKCGEAGSKYRGVSWSKSSHKWEALIRYDGKRHNLGYFENEEEAAKAYDRAATVHKGGGGGGGGGGVQLKFRGSDGHRQHRAVWIVACALKDSR
jgi:hypothetical protein